MEDADPYPPRRHLAAAASVHPHVSAATLLPPHGASAMDGRPARPLATTSVRPHISAAAPPSFRGTSAMDGQYNQCRDFFSQASSYAASGSSTYPAYFAADEFGLSSQALPSTFASSSQSASRMHMESLDLNSQANNFPHLDILPNQEQLQANGSRDGHGLPPLRPGDKGSRSHFNPPRPSEARSRSGAGSGGQGGLRGRVSIRVGRGSTSASTAVDVDHSDNDDEGDDNDDDPRFQSKDYDTARWNDKNIYYFCELFLEQVRKGNWNNGTMTTRGYIEMRKKYYHITNLWHDTKCMKNRVTNLKTMYVFWLKLNKDTGLGRKPDGTIDATPGWWKKNAKGECKKFQKGNPAFLHLLIEMFQGVAVDGSSSCIPGQQSFDDEGYGADEVSGAAAGTPAGSDEDMFGNSPMSISSHKRASSSATTAESPSKKYKRVSSSDTTAESPHKKSKAPLLNMMRGLVDKFDEDSRLSNEKLDEYRNSKTLRQMKKKQDRLEHIDRCLDMATECGASEETEEFFMATKLFEKEYNRNIFCKLTTSESRFLWLRRWCKGSSG